jgi:hypothetical protein
MFARAVPPALDGSLPKDSSLQAPKSLSAMSIVKRSVEH